MAPDLLTSGSCTSASSTFETKYGTNCIGFDANGCTTCTGNFYADPTTHTCKPTTVIPNCARYSNANTCLFCTSPFMFIKNTCTEKYIENCDIYKTSSGTTVTTCQYCAAGYILSSSATSCIKLADAEIIPGCLFYRADKTCAICEIGKIASIDRKTCFDPPQTDHCINY